MVEERVKRDEWRDTATSYGAEEAHKLFVTPSQHTYHQQKYEI